MVGPLARRALDAGTADSWFFIRWFTPGTHLRVRFHGDGSRLREQVQPALEAAVESTGGQGGLVYRLVLGTYEREIERYGGPQAMCLSERVFAADSEAALDLLGTVPGGDDGLRRRWHLALGGSAQILADMGLALDERLEVVSALRGHTARLTGTGTQVNTELGRKFRREREAVEALVEDPSGGDAVVARALATRSATLAPVVAGLRELHGEGQLPVGLADLAAIYVHLHVNRMLRSEHRAQELVLYDFLARVYRSQAARRLKPG